MEGSGSEGVQRFLQQVEEGFEIIWLMVELFGFKLGRMWLLLGIFVKYQHIIFLYLPSNIFEHINYN